MRRVGVASAGVAAVALLAGCEPSVTGVRVHIDSDLDVPSQLATVDIRIESCAPLSSAFDAALEDGGVPFGLDHRGVRLFSPDGTVPGAADGGAVLPIHIGVAPLAPDGTGCVSVTVTPNFAPGFSCPGLAAGGAVLIRQANFRPGEIRDVTVWINNWCCENGAMCSRRNGETCGRLSDGSDGCVLYGDGTSCADFGEVCNGFDEDCDGCVDDGVRTPFYADCDSDGFGEGPSAPADACPTEMSTTAVLDCAPPTAAPSVCGSGGTWSGTNGDCNGGDASIRPDAPETCNGIDDDCDGTADDGLDRVLTCGTGACARSTDECIDGVPQTCVPGTPSTETCNGIDDNCDGRVDDGFDRVLTCGTGACARSTPECVGGVPRTCVPGTPSTETCNRADDNCDGTIDNVPTYCGIRVSERPFSITSNGTTSVDTGDPGPGSNITLVLVEEYLPAADDDYEWDSSVSGTSATITTRSCDNPTCRLAGRVVTIDFGADAAGAVTSGSIGSGASGTITSTTVGSGSGRYVAVAAPWLYVSSGGDRFDYTLDVTGGGPGFSVSGTTYGGGTGLGVRLAAMRLPTSVYAQTMSIQATAGSTATLRFTGLGGYATRVPLAVIDDYQGDDDTGVNITCTASGTTDYTCAIMVVDGGSYATVRVLMLAF